MIRDIHIPFHPSKRQKEALIKGLVPQLKKYAQEETLKELNMLVMSHAFSCDKKCGGKNDEFCEIKEWLIDYIEAFKEEMI